MMEDDLVPERKKVGCFKNCHIMATKVMMGKMEENSNSLLVTQGEFGNSMHIFLRDRHVT